jgi:hypothetical protein
MTLPRRAFLASLLAAPFIPKFSLPKTVLSPPLTLVEMWRGRVTSKFYEQLADLASLQNTVLDDIPWKPNT